MLTKTLAKNWKGKTMLIVHKGQTITNKPSSQGDTKPGRVGWFAYETVGFHNPNVSLSEAENFAKEACERGACVSRAEGRRLYHKLKTETPKSCPCPLCFKCCCSQIEGLKDHAEHCVNREHGVCECR